MRGGENIGVVLDSNSDRRIFPRVDHVVHGWYRIGDEKFRRCKTLDVSLQGSLLVLDQSFEEGSRFELHLDLDADWQIDLEADLLWQRPIFFGKQFLTAVRYRFRCPKDKSMFGLWVQREKAHCQEKPDYLEPLKSESSNELHQLEAPPETVVKVQRWKQLLRDVTTQVPWVDEEKVLQCRRGEPRVPVGMKLGLVSKSARLPAQLLNVSGAGLRILLEPTAKVPRTFELVVSDDTLLVGRRRLSCRLVWKLPSDDGQLVCGLEVTDSEERREQSWLGDLLKRLNYRLVADRQALRLPRRIPVTIKAMGGAVVTQGHTLDIGLGGMKVRVDGELEIGSQVQVNLEYDELPIHLLARVLHRDEKGAYGLSFFKGGTENHLRLSRLLSRRQGGWSWSRPGQSKEQARRIWSRFRWGGAQKGVSHG